MRLATTLLLSALASSALLAACAGKPTPQPPPAATGAPLETALPSADPPAPAAPTAPPTAAPLATSAPSATPAAKPEWDKMTKEQRLDLMRSVVLPKMTASFQGFDAKKYATFNCASCHGAGAKDGSFAMPNAALPKLSTTGKFEAEMKKSPKATKYMMEKVVPEVAGALGLAPYDPTTKQGFGCFNCHVKAS